MDTVTPMNSHLGIVFFPDFIVIMAIDRIKEFKKDTEAVKWRKVVCRRLCDIYKEIDERIYCRYQCRC